MDRITARAIADSFRIRGSATYECCAGAVGLTDTQKTKLETLDAKRDAYYELYNQGLASKKAPPLTEIQEEERKTLIFKRDNPDLTEGAKTHCKKWLKETLYGRREELKNKYVTKGNEGEEDAFTLMALQLKLGMVYKNHEPKENLCSKGTCDLHHKKIVYDNKCSWSLDTFPLFEDELPDLKYWWQLQNYSTLWICDMLCLAYTLVNSSYDQVDRALRWVDGADEKYKVCERMIFDKKEFEYMKGHFFETATLDTFIEIPAADRIKTFYFEPDKKAKEVIEQRSQMCKEYIFSLLMKRAD